MSPVSKRPLAVTPLSSPELEGFRGRLEQGLSRLARLCELALAENEPIEDDSESTSDPWAGYVPNTLSERRAFPRRQSHCRVAVCRLPEGEDRLTWQQVEWRLHAARLAGELCDLSLTGAAIHIPQALPEGERIVLRLICRQRDRHLDQEARVVRSLPEETGEYRIICQFNKRLSLDEASYYSRFLNQTGVV